MTTLSTILAMGIMPANLWLYLRNFETDTLVVPYKKIALSLVTVTSPILVGMIMKLKIPTIAKWITKTGSFIGTGIAMICAILEIIVFPNMFNDIPLSLYLLMFAIPLLGVSLGYMFSLICRQTFKVRKTVAIECGIQNVPIALTVIAMSFPLKMQEDLVLLPLLYCFFMLITCIIMSIAYNYFKKRNERLAEQSYSFWTKKRNPKRETFMGNSKIIRIASDVCTVDTSKEEIENLMDGKDIKITLVTMKPNSATHQSNITSEMS